MYGGSREEFNDNGHCRIDKERTTPSNIIISCTRQKGVAIPNEAAPGTMSRFGSLETGSALVGSDKIPVDNVGDALYH